MCGAVLMTLSYDKAGPIKEVSVNCDLFIKLCS